MWNSIVLIDYIYKKKKLIEFIYNTCFLVVNAFIFVLCYENKEQRRGTTRTVLTPPFTSQ